MLAALPDLGALMAAVLLLLIAAALWILTELIVQSLGRAPLIGGWVKRDIGGWLNDARNAVLKAAGASWGAAVKMFDWATRFESTVFSRIVDTCIAAAITVDHIATVQVPHITAIIAGKISAGVSAAEAKAAQLVAAARKDLDNAIGAAEAKAAQLVAAARRDFDAAVSSAEAKATALVRAAETAAANALAKASTTLANDITAAERLAATGIAAAEATAAAADRALAGQITAGVAAAEAAAQSSLSAVRKGIYTDLETWGDQAVSRVWQDAEGDIAGLRRVIGGDFPWLNDLLGALGGLGAAGLAGALIRSVAGAEAITRLAEDCIVPNCRNLSQFGRDLQGLLALGSDAALLAWVAFLIADPSGWAADTESAATAVVDGTIAASKQLFGVH